MYQIEVYNPRKERWVRLRDRYTERVHAQRAQQYVSACWHGWEQRIVKVR
jgi:hypothetical protein